MGDDQDRKDNIRLSHMLDAAREALSFAKGASVESLHTNRMLALALLKELEILGEAAGQISPTFRERHTEIPWTAIIRNRHRLVHGYYDIDFQIIMSTIENDLPPLIEKLDRLLRTNK